MVADERVDRLLDAVLTVTGDLDLETVLRRIVEAACGLVGARYAALGVIAEDRQGLSQFVHTGLEPELVARIGHLPEGRGILGVLVDEPVPLRLDDLSDDPRSVGFPEGHPPMTRFLGAPIRIGDEVFGNLYLTDKVDETEFSAEDEHLVVALAAVAGATIARARLVDNLQRLKVIEDRERIGRDLHDTVIQRLFATGLSLQAAIRQVEDRPDVAERVSRAVDDIDMTIKQVRSTIFALQAPLDVVSVRGDVLRVVDEVGTMLPQAPRVRFDGPVDTVVGPALAEHLVPVVREALTNVAKHAHASQVDIEITATIDMVEVRVVDDGRGGVVGRKGGFGLTNLRERARACGGELTVTTPSTGVGTEVRWHVPVS